ncbi:MAG TPA: DUF4013 domain-containing protein [Anaerolineae bacterium]|nr:DUF4013 domain-containing protein [Anaerolineae bacterium]HQI84379.1 DUF4013 domain-containing protein [Anaerolineae bacterium]
MSEVATLGGLKRFFKFPFEGADWQKRFVIGAALILVSFIIPVIPLIFVAGYVMQVMRRAIEGQALELPEWADWGKLGVDGLRYSVVGLVFMLPGFLVYFGGMGIYMLAAMLLPVSMQMAEHARDVAVIPFLFMGSILILFVSIFLGMILTFLGTIPLPVALSHFVARDQVGAAFRFREWWPLLWRNKMGYFIAWVLCGGLIGILYYGIMMLYVTMVLCILIPVLSAPLLFYLMLVCAAVFGQTYRESKSIVEASQEESKS